MGIRQEVHKIGLPALGVFATSAAALMMLMPRPYSHIDYFIVGAVAVMLAMLVIFLLLIRAQPHAFIKRRRTH